MLPREAVRDSTGQSILVERPEATLALVTEREAIVPLLESLGLPTTPPVRARARSPTLFDSDPLPVYA